MIQVHRDDFLRIGAELFGEDRNNWQFRCASCGHVQSINDAKKRNPAVDESGWVHFHCEGRFLLPKPIVGCDWTLGGLFRIHELEIFDPRSGSFLPSFLFAHDRAEELLREAAANFEAPKHFETDAKTWAEFAWPDWVPRDLRQSIEKFWSWHGGPQPWAKDAVIQGAPVFGSRVRLPELCDSENQVEGRFVHAWNNIGRVVRDDGSVAYVSF